MAKGDNNNQAAREYMPQFRELLQAVYATQSYFGDFFAGGLEVLDGIQHKDVAFSIKTSDVPCVITTGDLGDNEAYSTDANTAFGTGTGKSTRFGERTEVIYEDTDVPYTWDWVLHEGIDRHTVNNDFEAAVADRLDLQAQKKIAMFNKADGEFISSVAGKNITDYTSITKDNVADVFNALHKYYVNLGTVGVKKAKVTSDVYAAIVDTGLMTASKNGTVSEDEQIVNRFKGFEIEEVPEDLFQANEVIYAYIENIGKAFTGIETTRTIESEDFDGVALQGAGKAGEFILPDNKAAVAKVTVSASQNEGA